MIELTHGNCLNELPKLESESVDCILTDPPYKYLKNQKFEVDFNEKIFFNEAKRVLKKTGFIVLFGRGTSFYRWNTTLAELGFIFKEEIIWNKMRTTSPVTVIGRRHETISIHSLGASINKVRVDFFEKYKYNPDKILATINRIATTFGNRNSFDLLKKYYDENIKIYNKSIGGWSITRSEISNKNMKRTIVFARGLEEGITEQSIIEAVGDWHSSIHPTQKPVRLLERLLQLVSKEGNLIIDPFAGSFSTAEACINLKLQFKGWEIDEEYFNAGKNRILELPKTLFNVQEIKIKL